MSKPTLEERLAKAKESASKINKLVDKGNAATAARIETYSKNTDLPLKKKANKDKGIKR